MINEWTDRWIWLMIWIGFDWIGLQALYGAAEDVWEVAEPETEQQESGDVDGHRDRRRLALALHRRPLPQRLGHGPLVQRRPQGPLGGNGRCRISHRLSRLMLVTTQRSTPINYHQSIDSLIPDVELLMMSAAPITCQLLMSRDIGLNHWFGGRRRVGGEGGRERKRVGCLRSMDERCSGGRWVNWNGFLLQLQWQEYRTPRATLLSLTADYYTISCARLTELNKKQGQDGKTGDALDVKCNIVILFFLSLSLSLSFSLQLHLFADGWHWLLIRQRLGDIAHTLLKVASYDSATMACRGLQQYVDVLMPNTDWSQEAMRPVLMTLFRRLDKIFSKIYKVPSMRVPSPIPSFPVPSLFSLLPSVSLWIFFLSLSLFSMLTLTHVWTWNKTWRFQYRDFRFELEAAVVVRRWGL